MRHLRLQEWYDCENCWTNFPQQMLTAYEWQGEPQYELAWFCDDCLGVADENRELERIG